MIRMGRFLVAPATLEGIRNEPKGTVCVDRRNDQRSPGAKSSAGRAEEQTRILEVLDDLSSNNHVESTDLRQRIEAFDIATDKIAESECGKCVEPGLILI